MSCTVDVSIDTDGKAATLISKSTMGSAMEKTIRTVAEIPSGPLFDTTQLSKDLKEQGFNSISAQLSGLTGLSLKASIADITKGLSAMPGCVTTKNTSGKNNIIITFSPSIISGAVELLSENEKAYLDLFMAPVLTGEQLTSSEYIDLVASVYGQSIADEISQSTMTVTMKQSVSGKSSTQKIPLLDILLLTGDQTVTFSLPL